MFQKYVNSRETLLTSCKDVFFKVVSFVTTFYGVILVNIDFANTWYILENTNFIGNLNYNTFTGLGFSLSF